MFWVVVASNVGATIYQAENRADPLERFESLDNAEYREASDRDRPGRSFDSVGEGRHAMSPGTDPKEHSAAMFAKRVADRIEAGRLGGEYDSLVLVAAPRMLGRLREEISDMTTPLLRHEVAQNLSHLKPDQIRAHLPELL